MPNPPLNAGLTFEKEAEALDRSTHNTTRIIRILALVTMSLALGIGTLLLWLTGSVAVFVGAVIESALCLRILDRNKKLKTHQAILLTYITHALSVLYFGLILEPTAQVQCMSVFLLGITFLLFDNDRDRYVAIAAIITVMLLIEGNNYVRVVVKVPMQPAHTQLIGRMIVVTVMFLNALMLYFYVAEIKRYRIRVNKYTGALKRSNFAMSRYQQEHSHQLRIEHNIMYGHLQHLTAKAASTDPNAEVTVKIKDINAMINAVRASTEFITNTMEWSRIQQGLELPVKWETFDLDLWLDGISERFRLMAEDKSADLILSRTDTPTFLLQDKTKMTVILSNLLSNAIKFTPRHTAVNLTVRLENNQIVFAVRDRGSGIPPERMEEVFQPFVTEQGTGIGLTVARELARTLLGDVYIDPVVKNGTAFIFTVPYLRPSRDDIKLLKQTTNQSLHGIRVLVVDDDAGCRRVAFLNLHEMGLIVYGSTNFATMKERLQESAIDLILLDYQLEAGVTAIDAIKWIRGYRPTSHIPIIVLSGETSVGDTLDVEMVCKRAGANAYLKKPVEFSALSQKIEQIVNLANVNVYL